MLSEGRGRIERASGEDERRFQPNRFPGLFADIAPRPDLRMSQHLLERVDRFDAAVRSCEGCQPFLLALLAKDVCDFCLNRPIELAHAQIFPPGHLAESLPKSRFERRQGQILSISCLVNIETRQPAQKGV